jgi:hypothetical protein
LATEEWQPISENLSVPAFHALHPHIRCAQCRRCYLYPHAGRFAHQHSDVAGGHEELLLDLLAADHLDADRLILHPPAGAGRLHDDIFSLFAFFLGGMLLCRGDDRVKRAQKNGRERPVTAEEREIHCFIPEWSEPEYGVSGCLIKPEVTIGSSIVS